MTRPSRGISDIQEKARGNDMKGMKKDVRKAAGPKPEKSAVKIKAKAPSAAGEGPMGMPAGRPGSFGGMGSLGMACGGAVKGYAKGGKIDGIASKGKTKGRIC